jgi:hypothetical protein
MSSSTYGAAVMLSSAYHDGDVELFDLIYDTVDVGIIVPSSFQLVYMLLHTFPGGRISNRAFDIRDEAFDSFAQKLSENSVKASAFSGADPQDIVTATTTIVMGSIVPLLEGDYNPPAVNIDQEGIDRRSFYVLLASINEAAVESFREYVGLTDLVGDLPLEPTYKEASDRLASWLPKIELSLMNRQLGNL